MAKSVRILFSHFYNEEYILPFWLRHHRELFDMGVLIDHQSTDSSCEIVRELTPHWEVLPTEDDHWDIYYSDLAEMVKQEKRFEGWKLCLNVTEFLCAASLEAVEARVEEGNFVGAHARGVIMVESDQSGLPRVDPKQSLVAQRTVGYFEDEKSWGGFLRRHGFDFVQPVYRSRKPTRLRTRPYLIKSRNSIVLRSRLYHKMRHGAYYMGRHESYWGPQATPPQDDLLVLNYCFSPNTPEMRQRACRVSNRVSAEYKRFMGGHYYFERKRDPTYFDREREALVPRARDLLQNKVFARNTAPWRHPGAPWRKL